MEKEIQNNYDYYYEEDELVIDWMGILTRMLKHWKQIILIGFIFGCLGVVSALRMTRQYNVTVTLAPERQNRSASLSSISSMLGLGSSASSGQDAMNISLFPEICQSTPFLVSLLDVPLTSYVSEKQLEDGVKPMQTTVYRHFSGEDKPNYKPRKDEKPYTGVTDPTELTPRQSGVVKALARSVAAKVDNKTGITSISVTMDDRLMAKQLADTVCVRLQANISDYRTKKATADYEYYVMLADEAHAELVKAQAAYAHSVDYDRSVILQSATAQRDRLRDEVSLASQIYSQMAQQRELARAKIQEDKPVYAVVQPAVLPQSPINSRTKRVIIWGFVGGFLALIWYGFGAELFKKMRSGVKEKMQEDEQ